MRTLLRYRVSQFVHINQARKQVATAILTKTETVPVHPKSKPNVTPHHHDRSYTVRHVQQTDVHRLARFTLLIQWTSA